MSRKTQGGSGIAAPIGSALTLLDSQPTVSTAWDMNDAPETVLFATLAPQLVLDHTSRLISAAFKLQCPPDADGSMRCAIYADAAGEPGALMLQSSPVQCATIVDPTLPTAFAFAGELPAGNYFVGLTASNDADSTVSISAGGIATLVPARSYSARSPVSWVNHAAETARAWCIVKGT